MNRGENSVSPIAVVVVAAVVVGNFGSCSFSRLSLNRVESRNETKHGLLLRGLSVRYNRFTRFTVHMHVYGVEKQDEDTLKGHN